MAWEKIKMNNLATSEYYINIYRGTKDGKSTGIRISSSSDLSKFIIANDFKYFEVMIDKDSCRVGLHFIKEQQKNTIRLTISQNKSSENATPRVSCAFSSPWKQIVDSLKIRNLGNKESVKFKLDKEDDDFLTFDCSELQEG